MATFLIHLLGAQAETLQLLAGALGEEELLALLDQDEPPQSKLTIDPQLFGEEAPVAGMSSPYQEIEGAVRELDLTAPLEFYLWAYPTYRAFVESALTLDSRVSRGQAEGLTALTDGCITDARAWLASLPVPSSLHGRLEKLTAAPWLKFRSAVLREGGQKRLRSL